MKETAVELIKLSDSKTKLILSPDELELYGVREKSRKNLSALQKIFKELKKSSGIDLFSDSISVKLRFFENGECEITVDCAELSDALCVRTFLLDKKTLDRLLSVLKNADFSKASALYEYKNGIYIWEILDRKSSPLPCRIADFARECFLLDRRNFLTVLCRRIPFPDKKLP
jgi:hypothetical protein